MFWQIYEKNEGEGMRFCVLCDGKMLGVIDADLLFRPYRTVGRCPGFLSRSVVRLGLKN